MSKHHNIPQEIKDAYALATKNRRKGQPYDKAAIYAYQKARLAASGSSEEVVRLRKELAAAQEETKKWQQKWISHNQAILALQAKIKEAGL